MARPLRIEFPGAIYHIIQKGLEGRNIFHTHRDREKFLKYISKACIRYNCDILGYCLMTNHFHLILETIKANLSQVMHYISTAYAIYFKSKRKVWKNCPVYQGRYKSIVVQDGMYLQHLSRYIHLNPLRAKMIKDPIEYPYSSYRYFVSEEETPEWLKIDRVLRLFNQDESIARSIYKEFVVNLEVDSSKIMEENCLHGLIIGDSEYFEWIKNTVIGERVDREIPKLRKMRRTIEMDDIINTTRLEVEASRVQRDVAIYLIRKYTEKTLQEIAEIFNLGYPYVSKIYSRVEKDREQDKRLDGLIKNIEETLEAKGKT